MNHLRFYCEWCPMDVDVKMDEMILLGCIDQHLAELRLCAQHAMIWMKAQWLSPHDCHICGKKIIEFITINNKKIVSY
jgi:hypothetical protein